MFAEALRQNHRLVIKDLIGGCWLAIREQWGSIDCGPCAASGRNELSGRSDTSARISSHHGISLLLHGGCEAAAADATRRIDTLTLAERRGGAALQRRGRGKAALEASVRPAITRRAASA
jgi:hypothetical protein